MARLKNDLRSCELCSHRKMDIENLCYYCSNRQSEHFLESIRNITSMHQCKGGNAKLENRRK